MSYQKDSAVTGSSIQVIPVDRETQNKENMGSRLTANSDFNFKEIIQRGDQLPICRQSSRDRLGWAFYSFGGLGMFWEMAEIIEMGKREGATTAFSKNTL